MDAFQVIMIMVAVFQPIAVALLSWVLFKLNKLDRENGEQSVGIANIIKQIKEGTQATNRELDSKQDKD